MKKMKVSLNHKCGHRMRKN